MSIYSVLPCLLCSRFMLYTDCFIHLILENPSISSLRLAADLPKADKVLIIERVIESLGLQGVRDSLVGTVEMRGISGGQKKRVNVGMEMVMEPSLLILDEPTSGLDSASSNLLLKALRREALEGVNICMVLHQPRLVFKCNKQSTCHYSFH